MLQDLVLAIFLISYHRGLYMITSFCCCCPENQRVLIMEIKVSPKMFVMPWDENIN